MAKTTQTEATTQATPIVVDIIVAEDLIVIATETVTNGAVENMNGVAVITTGGLMSIPITGTISTVRMRTTPATRTACLPVRTTPVVGNLTIPNGRIFISTPVEVSCQSLAIQRLTAPLIATALCGATKKGSRIGSPIS
jgi:hypothetical protein